eukprot:scaffold267898_cov18-Tisochrysis_lutea.AAC.1
MLTVWSGPRRETVAVSNMGWKQPSSQMLVPMVQGCKSSSSNHGAASEIPAIWLGVHHVSWR